MAVRSIKNQYLGINAHLHSLWQARGGWPEFHTFYVQSLLLDLRPILRPMGYAGHIEPSLQIRRIEMRRLKNAPISEKGFRALTIYDTHTGENTLVARIEVLTPTNKPDGVDAKTYMDQRREVLEKGVALVEVDYLHETSPTLRALPDYSHKERDSHPYCIVVLDPRPNIMKGHAQVYAFDVASPIPVCQLPLNEDTELTVDFNQPYHKTLEDALYGLEFIDYAEFPENFNRYREDDQRRIALRMLSVLEAAQAGVDLETGPFPVKDLSLEEALKAIEVFKANR